MKHFNPSESALKGLLPPDIFSLNIKIQLTLTNYLILHCISVSHVSFQPCGSLASNADLGLQRGSRRLWQTFHIPPRSPWPFSALVLWQPAVCKRPASASLPLLSRVSPLLWDFLPLPRGKPVRAAYPCSGRHELGTLRGLPVLGQCWARGCGTEWMNNPLS